MTTLYAYHYIDGDDIHITVYQGIYEKHSTNSNKVYPAVTHLGNVNITQRRFYKAKKFPMKVLPETTLKELPILFTELGYDDNLLEEITNIVLTKSADKSIKTYELWRHNEYGSMDGIVNF